MEKTGICSQCVIAFLTATQDYLKWLYELAIKNSMLDKAWAIESFILPEETHGGTKPSKKHGRRLNRKRGSRPSANKKGRIKQIKT